MPNFQLSISHSPLIRPQCLDGLDFRGLAGREKTGQRAGYDERHCSLYGDAKVYRRVAEHLGLEHAGIHRLVAEGVVHPLRHADARHHADVAEEGGDDDTLHDDEPQDGSRLGAQCLADAELVGALAHGDEHDVRHAHDAAQQRKDADDPDGRAQDAHGVHGAQVVGKAVPYPDGARVVGREAVVGADDAAVFRFEGFVALEGGQAVGGQEDVVQLVALVVDGLQGAEGDVGFARFAVALVVVDAHHLIGHAPGVDKLADGLGVGLAEEDVGRLLVEDDDLAPLLQVDVVDEAPLGGLYGLDFRVVGVYAQQGEVDVLLAEADVEAALAHGGAHAGHVVGELRFGVRQVAVVQLDAPPFLQAVVRLGGPAGEDADGVERPLGRVLLESVDEAVACAQQHDEHEDAPRHGKARQEGA